MKKVFCVFLAIVLLGSLWCAVVAETANLEAGSYIVGSDLPAGEYEITCIKVSNAATDYMDSMSSLFGDDEDMQLLFGVYGSLASSTAEATVKIKGAYGENKGSFTLKENEKKKLTLQKDWTITIEDAVLSFQLLQAAPEEPAESETNTKPSRATSDTLNMDLSQYSDDEIVALYGMVNQEIVSRKLKKSAKVPSGTYIVGEDIPAGKYLLERLTDTSFTYLYIFADRSQELKIVSESLYDDETCVITLEEGNVLQLASDMLFTVYTGVSFE